MSGGSLDYLYAKVDEAADRIADFGAATRQPAWIAFANHLRPIARALHNCEWVMSCDMGHDGADAALADVFGDAFQAKSLEVICRDLESMAKLISRILGASGFVFPSEPAAGNSPTITPYEKGPCG